MMKANAAREYVLANLPSTVKAAVRMFVDLLHVDTQVSLDEHIYPVADRYAGVDPRAEARDELQLIADGPFAKKKRNFPGDESLLFYKRDGRNCPPEIWIEHGGSLADSSRGGTYIKIWPKHPHVHWHRRHRVNELAALEHVNEKGVRYITSDDVVKFYSIQDSPGVNARSKGARRIKNDPNFVSIGAHQWANIATLPPADRSIEAGHACRRAVANGNIEFQRAILAGHPEQVAEAFGEMIVSEFDLDMVARIVSAVTKKFNMRAAETANRGHSSA